MKDSYKTKSSPGANIQYLVVVSLLTFVFPLIGFVTEHLINNIDLTFSLFGKWFIFSAVGLRLFLAGIRQTITPAFTAQQIFHIDSPDVLPVIREVGFANLCFGLVGIISVCKPEWRIVSAFASGLYYGFAGLQHLIKKPAGINEHFALWTDIIIFALLAVYVFTNF